MSDQLRAELAEVARDVLDACTCEPYPLGDGPEIDCPMHGRADFQGLAIADALLPVVARIKAEAKAEAVAAVEALHSGNHWCQDEGGCSDLFMVGGETDAPWPCPTLAALSTGRDDLDARLAEAWDEGYVAADFAVHRGIANPCAVVDRGNPYRAEASGREGER